MAEQKSRDDDSRPPPSYGHAMLKHFSLEEGYLNLNHGSYGLTPRVVQEACNRYRAMAEARPDPFHRTMYQPMLRMARADIAKYVGAAPSDVVLVENASAGINAVLRSLKFEAGDKILVLEDAYAMIRRTTDWLSKQYGVEVVTVKFKFPVHSDEELLEPFREVLRRHGSDIKAAVIDHTMSTPAVILPIAEIFELIKQHTRRPGDPSSRCNLFSRAVCICDGAHALGQIDLQPEATGADAYVSNGHKWLFAARGAAVLWVGKFLQPHVVPTVLGSHAVVNPVPDFVANFEHTGTRDYSPLISMSDALKFRESVGGDKAIKAWNNELMRYAQEHLSSVFGTEALDQRPGADKQGSLANVRLPFTDWDLAERVTQKLLDVDRCFIVRYPHSDAIWIRISCQIYNERADIELIGRKILQYAKELGDKGS